MVFSSDSTSVDPQIFMIENVGITESPVARMKAGAMFSVASIDASIVGIILLCAKCPFIITKEIVMREPAEHAEATLKPSVPVDEFHIPLEAILGGPVTRLIYSFKDQCGRPEIVMLSFADICPVEINSTRTVEFFPACLFELEIAIVENAGARMVTSATSK
jgi:hypothetical protein